MFTLLRLAKKNPAAATMIAQPAIVKSVVPIPPVCGSECNFESATFAVATGLSPFAIVTLGTSTTEYPAGAFSSTISYSPSSSPFATTTPSLATIFVTLTVLASAICD